jgi:hypothetical protein
VQAKFGQYLQDAKNPRSISQTEKAVEREQIRSNEQILPTPVLHHRMKITHMIHAFDTKKKHFTRIYYKLKSQRTSPFKFSIEKSDFSKKLIVLV